MSSIAIGTANEQEAIRDILKEAPHLIDLSGKTSLLEVAALARRAEIVVGNDTGPTHMAAAVGARTFALMSEKVNPFWSAPSGPNAVWLQGKPIASLTAEAVLRKIES